MVGLDEVERALSSVVEDLARFSNTDPSGDRSPPPDEHHPVPGRQSSQCRRCEGWPRGPGTSARHSRLSITNAELDQVAATAQ